MNANEAISKIRFMLDVGGSDGFTSADKEALNMAINVLSAEITAPPKSNGDRIRQMTDEELVREFSDSICNIVENCEKDISCYDCKMQWLKQEVDLNDERRQDQINDGR